MKKQLMIIGIILLLLTVGLSGCINNPLDFESKKFVGTWKDSQSSYNAFTFLSDGTGSLSGASIYWEKKDGKLVINIPVSGTEVKNIFDYSFSDNDQTLTLTSVSTGTPNLNYTLVKQ